LTDKAVGIKACGDQFKSGGHIQHSAVFNGQIVPADFVYSPNSDGTSPYKYEHVYWDQAGGCVYSWVKNPTLSHTNDWVFYAAYNDASVTTYQGGSVGDVWAATYVAVYHFAPKGDGSVSLVDSTSHGNTWTNSGGVEAAGPMGGAASFDTSSYMSVAGTGLSLHYANMTVEAWANSTTQGNNIVDKWGGTYNYALTLNTAGHPWWVTAEDGTPYIQTGTATLSPSSTLHQIDGVKAGGGQALYVDGASDSTLGCGSGTVDTSSDAAYIGQWNGGTGSAGVVAEMRFISTNLSAGEIATNYNNLANYATYVTQGAEQGGGGGARHKVVISN